MILLITGIRGYIKTAIQFHSIALDEREIYFTISTVIAVFGILSLSAALWKDWSATLFFGIISITAGLAVIFLLPSIAEKGIQ